jgi:hypothetical protein
MVIGRFSCFHGTKLLKIALLKDRHHGIATIVCNQWILLPHTVLLNQVSGSPVEFNVDE